MVTFLLCFFALFVPGQGITTPPVQPEKSITEVGNIRFWNEMTAEKVIAWKLGMSAQKQKQSVE